MRLLVVDGKMQACGTQSRCQPARTAGSRVVHLSVLSCALAERLAVTLQAQLLDARIADAITSLCTVCSCLVTVSSPLLSFPQSLSAQ